MPDRGLLERANIVAAALGGALPGPWTLTNARWAQLTFEVAKEAALLAMPGDVSRPVPCYARLVVLEAPLSPVGPFKLAALLVGGRYRLMPKNVLVDGIVDGPVDALSAAFGGPFRPGSVSLEREGARLSATVSAGGDVLASVVMPSLYAVEPSMLRWDAWLGYSSDDGVLNIVEWGPQPQAREAFLSKSATLETPAALPRSHLWRMFRSLNTISACYEEGDVALAAPAVQQAIL